MTMPMPWFTATVAGRRIAAGLEDEPARPERGLIAGARAGTANQSNKGQSQQVPG
ncbi:hypothetical protein FHW79_005345 [Azospirillum sp. OGB3]|nr:hypothetical protein [Azospirillum sp. OGB3]